jgi:Xaa-Pro aminopeptidase
MASSKLKLHQDFSRRALLRRASAGIAASLAAPFLPASVLAGQTGHEGRASGNPPLSPESMPKEFSREEYQRRWHEVRERMRANQFDCLLIPQHRPGAMIPERPDGDADVQYFTGIPAGWVVLPHEGKITAISTPQLKPLLALKKPVPGIVLTSIYAEDSKDIEIRFTEEEGAWSGTIIDCLRERDLTEARIGVGSLADIFRNAEGSVNYTTFDRVRRAVPQARFGSAGDLLWRVKLVHSPEEVAVLERAAQVSEAGLEAMMKTARPGVVQREVWLSVFRAMVEASGERPWRVSLRAGAEGNTALGFPLEEVLGSGQILNQEISGSVLGYGAQVNHSVLLGSPAPADWPSAAQYCLETFHLLLDMVKPGRNVNELCDFYEQRVKARGGKGGGVFLHSGGLSDLPRWAPGRTEGAGLVLEPGMVFDIKPSAPITGVSPMPQFGDSVVVTEKGARRLGKRRMEIVTLGA